MKLWKVKKSIQWELRMMISRLDKKVTKGNSEKIMIIHDIGLITEVPYHPILVKKTTCSSVWWWVSFFSSWRFSALFSIFLRCLSASSRLVQIYCISHLFDVRIVLSCHAISHLPLLPPFFRLGFNSQTVVILHLPLTRSSGLIGTWKHWMMIWKL